MTTLESACSTAGQQITTTSTMHSETADFKPFCAFCLRARPQGVEFFRHVIGASDEMRTSLQSMLGYEFNLANFAICKPCWKLMQLMQDFRLRCFKANAIVEKVTRGLGGDEGWFSARNTATIEAVRLVVQDQVQQIGKINVVKRELMLDVSIDEEEERDELGKTTEVQEELQSEVTIGETKLAIVDVGITDSKQKYECQTCSRNFETNLNLSKHGFFCKPVPDIRKCNLCSVILPNPEALKTHLENHAKKVNFRCRLYCDKRFYSEAERTQHQLVCIVRPQTCNICRKQLPNRHSLQEHYKQDHQGERIHKCVTCGKRFKEAHLLQHHETSQHSVEMSIYPCSVCDKSFTHLGSVREHMKVHTGEKPFKCKICDKEYYERKGLNDHNRNYHSVELMAKMKVQVS